MRDYIFIAVFFGMLPFCLRKPWLGILAWAWISLLNPHRATWGFAYTFPVAKIVAGVTLFGFLFDRTKRGWPNTRESWLLLLFASYMTFTTFFAFHSDLAWQEWDRVIKIQGMTIVSLFLLQERQRIRWFLLVVALSVGFFGVKGGAFSLLKGGQYRVYGPSDSFIQDNNALALALIMVLPLLLSLGKEFESTWVRRGFYAAGALGVISAIFSYSRGAFLALSVVFAIFLATAKRKWIYGPLACAAIAVAVAFVPEQWFARMETIKTYDQDASAMGRINAWWFAYNLAVDRPLVGGGFRSFKDDLFFHYAPDPTDVHDAHSIYFEVLGEHGFGGLVLFLAILGSTTLSLLSLRRRVRGVPGLEWVTSYTTALGMSLAAYVTGGAFLGLAYFDLPYYLVAAVICMKVVVERDLAARADATRAPATGVRWTRSPAPAAGGGPRG